MDIANGFRFTIKKKLNDILNENDVIVCPVSYGEPPKKNIRKFDWEDDFFTVPFSLAGLSSITIPLNL